MITYVVVLFIWFIIAMWFLRRKHQIREKLGKFYYAVVGVVLGGLVLDVIFQWTFAILIFFEVTPNVTFSKRMERYRENPKYKGMWRMRWADFICERILNPYDPDGKHC